MQRLSKQQTEIKYAAVAQIGKDIGRLKGKELTKYLEEIMLPDNLLEICKVELHSLAFMLKCQLFPWRKPCKRCHPELPLMSI